MDNLETVFEKHYADVFRYLRGLTGSEDFAEELTQECFYRAAKSLKDFRGDCDVRVWLCQIGKNLWYEQLRKEKKTVPIEDNESPSELPDLSEPFVSMLLDRETAREIHRALHRLKEPYKEIFTLRVFGELSFEDIGNLFDKSAHWACVTYHRAKEMIRQGIGE